MRAWLMDTYEGVEKLRLDEVPAPQPGPGQVLIRILFAGLNPADAFLALAQYPAKPSLPHVLGRDGVGEVVALGPGIEGSGIEGHKAADLKPGDIVGILRGNAGTERWGTLAEMTVVDSSDLIPLPQGWTQQELAGAPLVYLTAWQALTQWSQPDAPPPSDSVALITGASGGVGSAAVLLAKSMGLTVVALSRSHQKATQLKQLGADLVFDPSEKNVRKLVLAALAPRRVDIVVDTVGGPLFNELIAMLGYMGRISLVGRSGGVVPDFNTATLFFRRNRIGGVSVADYSAAQAKAAWEEIVTRLDALGKRPVVDGVFAFDDVKAAFARLSQGPMGKVLVKVGA